MRRGELAILYIVLTVVSVLMAWKLVSAGKLANVRYTAPKPARAEAVVPLAPPSAQRVLPPITEIAAKNLFSADRNNELVQDDKNQPVPPAPIVFGTMNLGGKYEALMTEQGQATRSFKRVKSGERVGGYMVVEIADDRVVVEYQGQKTTIDVYQSANSVPRVETRTATAAAPVVESVGASSPPPAAAAPPPAGTAGRPPAAGGPSPSAPGDHTPGVRVTIEGNRKRLERNSIVGPQVWYEPLDQ